MGVSAQCEGFSYNTELMGLGANLFCGEVEDLILVTEIILLLRLGCRNILYLEISTICTMQYIVKHAENPTYILYSTF